jgi:ElaB/YqjD/DUF883 family membrane-anchored ribosome-binding protein
MANEKDFHGELDAIKSDIRQLHSDIRELMQTFKENGKQTAHAHAVHAGQTVSEFAQERLGHIKNAATLGAAYIRQAAATAQSYGKAAAHKTQMQLRQRPITTLLVAMGIGVILGKIIGRSRSES